MRIFSNGILVQISYENEKKVRALFCHNKYRFFDLQNGEYAESEIDYMQRSKDLSILDWEEFKKKVKDRYDLDIDDNHKPSYVK